MSQIEANDYGIDSLSQMLWDEALPPAIFYFKVDGEWITSPILWKWEDIADFIISHIDGANNIEDVNIYRLQCLEVITSREVRDD